MPLFRKSFYTIEKGYINSHEKPIKKEKQDFTKRKDALLAYKNEKIAQNEYLALYKNTSRRVTFKSYRRVTL